MVGLEALNRLSSLAGRVLVVAADIGQTILETLIAKCLFLMDEEHFEEAVRLDLDLVPIAIEYIPQVLRVIRVTAQKFPETEPLINKDVAIDFIKRRRPTYHARIEKLDAEGIDATGYVLDSLDRFKLLVYHSQLKIRRNLEEDKKLWREGNNAPLDNHPDLERGAQPHPLSPKSDGPKPKTRRDNRGRRQQPRSNR